MADIDPMLQALREVAPELYEQMATFGVAKPGESLTDYYMRVYGPVQAPEEPISVTLARQGGVGMAIPSEAESKAAAASFGVPYEEYRAYQFLASGKTIAESLQPEEPVQSSQQQNGQKDGKTEDSGFFFMAIAAFFLFGGM